MRNKALPQPGSNLDNESVEPGAYGNNYGSNEPFEPGNGSNEPDPDNYGANEPFEPGNEPFEPGNDSYEPDGNYGNNVDNGSYEPGNGNFVDNGSFEPDGNRNNEPPLTDGDPCKWAISCESTEST